MSYWSKLPVSIIDSLAEAALAQATHIERAVVANVAKRGAYPAYDYAVIETANNLEALIAACPDSDVLRAEALAFSFDRLASAIGDEKLTTRAHNAMMTLRERPAYKALSQKFPALY